MTLTVKEKEHWKIRIEERIDRKIKQLSDKCSPPLLTNVEEKARARALKELGVTAFARERDELEKRLKLVTRKIVATVIGKELEMIECPPSWYHQRQHDETVNAAEDRATALLLAEDKVGKEILRLREEKNELIDTVWLATSPRQVRELWQDVASLLAEKPTSLQQSAIARSKTLDDQE